ncbi:MAG: hypothetical protein FWG98_07245 [Candidatus Cloacimonetes bacterium]|nr:hypothetical protein [Candidatus Cloacimonadota bacterium]
MTENNATINQKEKKPKGKFTIIDLLMIIMIVGVALTITLPLKQAREHEAIVRNSVMELEKIMRANEFFRLNSGWDSYAMDLSQLRGFSPQYLRDLDTSIFTFTVTDTSIVATTNHLAQTEKGYWFDLRDKRFRVNDDSKDVIVDAWLP